MVGGAPYARALHPPRPASSRPPTRGWCSTGPVYGEGYRELLFHARAYIHATEVGGTHPALVEAMGAGRVVFFLDNLPNREVVRRRRRAVPLHRRPRPDGGAAAQFVARPGAIRRASARRRARAWPTRYRWDDVAAAYERLLEGLCSANPRA